MSTDCPAVSRAVRPSFAPSAREMTARAPMPAAKNTPLTSHVTEPVRPTAAEACAPSTPTMAVSTYCTSVCMAFSSITGQDKVKSAAVSGQYSRSLARRARYQGASHPLQRLPLVLYTVLLCRASIFFACARGRGMV